MKKIILSVFAIFMIAIGVNAATWVAADRVSTVGSKLLTKNGVSTKITFKVVDGAADNTSAVSNKVIQISSTDLSYAGNDNEVAAVVANELGHIICNHYDKSKWRTVAASQLGVDTTTGVGSLVKSHLSSAEESEADIMGANLMINAGYNPLAMVVLVTKFAGSTMDTIMGRPCNAERAMEVYNFLTYNYPAKVKSGYSCNEYKTFLAYANPIVEKRNSNKKQLAKFKKEQEKNKKTRTKQLQTYKTNGGLSSWGVTYDALMNMKNSN